MSGNRFKAERYLTAIRIMLGLTAPVAPAEPNETLPVLIPDLIALIPDPDPVAPLPDPVDGQDPPLILQPAYFQAGQDGSLPEALCHYGPDWNEETCFSGRAIVLYQYQGAGPQVRLEGRISGFRKQPARSLPAVARKAVRTSYGTLDLDMACLTISDLPEAGEGQ